MRIVRREKDQDRILPQDLEGIGTERGEGKGRRAGGRDGGDYVQGLQPILSQEALLGMR